VPEYLIGFSYHEPERYALWQRGVIEDFESNTGLWIKANTPEEAISWCEKVAETLHRLVNGDPAADWSGAGHDCWVEKSPATSCWNHCLDFFQRLSVGEMPLFDRMGGDAFARWLKQRHAEPATAHDRSRKAGHGK
jgi:hypothetical protein